MIWDGEQTKVAGKEKNSWDKNFVLQKANLRENGYDEINNCRDATEIWERKEREGKKKKKNSEYLNTLQRTGDADLRF